MVESAGIYDAITRRTRLQIEVGFHHMSRDTTERDPLLQATILADESRTKGKIEKTRIGPLELSRSTRYGILAGIWTATFVSALNQTLVPTMIPSISSEFKKSNQASWLGTSYLLATCTFTPLYGRLSNVLGRRGANQTALLFCGLGVLMCGLSTNMYMLIAARFLAGMGGGGLFTTSSIIVGDMYSMRSRGLTQGVQSIFNGLGLGFGGPLGGIITDWLGWRWAFLIQMPLFLISYILTSYNLDYVTEGKGKTAKEVLKRIDYGGSFSLLMTVGALLLFLSAKYNASLPWSHPYVIGCLASSAIFAFAFVLLEFFVAPEPVLAPHLLKQKIPVLIGMSNFLVALCNFTVMYYFPMWFQTVMKTKASVAGLHLLPNSISMSMGSLFAGLMMHATGRYKMINLIFGAFPFLGACLIYLIHKDSGPIQSWFSIIPLGFGNGVVLQTMLIALLVHIPENQMAVGTGFSQLFRGVGQVGGVAISSAIFQSNLETQLRRQIHTPDSEDLIRRIRQSFRFVDTLTPDLQKIANDSYGVSLKSVFLFAAVSTLLSYLVRLPVPDKILEHTPRQPRRVTDADVPSEVSPSSISVEENVDDDDSQIQTNPSERNPPRRRLSAYEPNDAVMDLERDIVGGSARPTT